MHGDIDEVLADNDDHGFDDDGALADVQGLDDIDSGGDDWETDTAQDYNKLINKLLFAKNLLRNNGF